MRIVIVDDDRLMAAVLSDSIKEILGKEVEITVYNDPLVAKSKVGSRPVPDIAFMDIEMPGLSGIELTKYCKSVFPKGHIVFVTSHTEHALMAWQLQVDGYLLKPVKTEDIKNVIDHIGLLDRTGMNAGSKLSIRCFGRFEVYYDGKPVRFTRSRAKELLAYLVAARGSGVTSGELCGVFWDDAMELGRKKTYLRQYASALRSALRNCGCEDAFIHSRDSYSVNIGMIDCDYFRYLVGDTSHGCDYFGEFMCQYEWAEEIGAQLSDYEL